MQKKILTIILCCIALTVLQAQKLSFRSYNVEDGLPVSSVTEIIQDHKGYIWFATLDGISRFDGINFDNYSTSHGLRNKEVWSIYEDSNHTLWIGTSNGLYTFSDSLFSSVNVDTAQTENFTITSIAEDREGKLYFATRESGLYVYSNGSFIHYTTDDGLLDNELWTVIVLEDGKVAIGSAKGLSFFDGNKFKNYNAKNGFITERIRCLYQDKEGALWIGATGSGLCKYEHDEFTWFTTEDGLTHDYIYDIEEDYYGNLWIATYVSISKFDGEEFVSIKQNNGLPQNTTVLTILKDQENILWFGLYDAGVTKLNSEKFISYDQQTGLPNDLVYAIVEDDNYNIWVGTNSGLSKVYNNSITNYTTADGLTHTTINSLAVDKSSNLWIGTKAGVTRYANGSFNGYTASNGLTDATVGVIFTDSKGNTWFGTDGDGVYKHTDGRFTHITTEDGLISNEIWGITEDTTGTLWFASKLSGICTYDGQQFKTFPKQNRIFAEAQIFTIDSDNQGRIWIATQNNGFFIFKDGAFQHYNRETGLSNNTCYFFVRDYRGYTWIGTNQGLNRFYQGDFRLYTNKAGLITNEFVVGAGYNDSKGFLWFGSIKGLIRFDPRLDRDNTVPPPVYITRFRIFDNDTSFNKPLELNYTENYLRFDYEGLSYTSPEQILYQYKLDGVDQTWHNSKLTTVQYTSLSAGEYVFRVRARNNNGVWSDKPATFSFEILPPFWETWWFRVLAVIFIVGSFIAIYIYRTYKLRQRNIELARLVKERTRDLELEKEKSDELLHNILPGETVKELKEHGEAIPREHKEISILFTDFKGFTTISSGLEPKALVNELNNIFTSFDEIIDQFGLEKLKTIGDAYMIAGGLPKEADDHAIRLILAAMKLQDYMAKRRLTSEIKWEMRAGIHSGRVVAGVVGKRKFTYDIWGDTVNVASRMESSGSPNRINVSHTTYNLAKDYFDFENRGKIMAKGKGEIDMYFVTAVKQKTLDLYPFVDLKYYP